MILRPFLSNQPYILALLVPVLALFCTLNLYFGFHAYFPRVDLGLWGKTELLDQWWFGIISALIVGANAVQINILFNTHEFLDRNNYGPSLFYVTLMSFSHSFYQPDGLLLAHVCWIQAIRLMFRIRQNEDIRRTLFNAAFFVGLASTFHPASAGMLLFFWFGTFSLKPLTGREWLISLFGFCIPPANALVYWWYSGHRMDLSLLRDTPYIAQEKLVYYTTTVLMIILFVLSLIGIQVRLKKSSIRFKKLTRSLLWVLLGGVFLGAAQLVFYRQIEWFNFIFITLSFFFTFAFLHRLWKAVATFFFYAALILAVVKYFLPAQLSVL
jgi:hypothetical protein